MGMGCDGMGCGWDGEKRLRGRAKKKETGECVPGLLSHWFLKTEIFSLLCVALSNLWIYKDQGTPLYTPPALSL